MWTINHEPVSFIFFQTVKPRVDSISNFFHWSMPIPDFSELFKVIISRIILNWRHIQLHKFICFWQIVITIHRRRLFPPIWRKGFKRDWGLDKERMNRIFFVLNWIWVCFEFCWDILRVRVNFFEHDVLFLFWKVFLNKISLQTIAADKVIVCFYITTKRTLF